MIGCLENKDAIRLLSLPFSLTLKRQERTDALRREFGFDIGTQEEQELEQMQEMLSINEVYKERMEVEIRLANERAGRAEDEVRHVKDQARASEDKARAIEAQNISIYIESGLQFGADSAVLVQAVQKKFGLSHQDAVLQGDAVRQHQLSHSD